MKLVKLLFLLILFWLVACQAAIPDPSQTLLPYPPQRSVPPTEGISYPAPQPILTATPTGEGYPPPQPSPTEVSWEEARARILEGKVVEVIQLHSMSVYLILEDGHQLHTVEPVIDDVLKVLEECGQKCTQVKVITQ